MKLLSENGAPAGNPAPKRDGEASLEGANPEVQAAGAVPRPPRWPLAVIAFGGLLTLVWSAGLAWGAIRVVIWAAG